jgi:hypothetical protein
MPTKEFCAYDFFHVAVLPFISESTSPLLIGGALNFVGSLHPGAVRLVAELPHQEVVALVGAVHHFMMAPLDLPDRPVGLLRFSAITAFARLLSWTDFPREEFPATDFLPIVLESVRRFPAARLATAFQIICDDYLNFLSPFVFDLAQPLFELFFCAAIEDRPAGENSSVRAVDFLCILTSLFKVVTRDDFLPLAHFSIDTIRGLIDGDDENLPIFDTYLDEAIAWMNAIVTHAPILDDEVIAIPDLLLQWLSKIIAFDQEIQSEENISQLMMDLMIKIDNPCLINNFLRQSQELFDLLIEYSVDRLSPPQFVYAIFVKYAGNPVVMPFLETTHTALASGLVFDESGRSNLHASMLICQPSLIEEIGFDWVAVAEAMLVYLALLSLKNAGLCDTAAIRNIVKQSRNTQGDIADVNLIWTETGVSPLPIEEILRQLELIA